jgi:hypothetical protein
VRGRDLTDTVADLLVDIVHHIGSKAETRVEEQLVEELKRVAGKNGLLYNLAEVALNHPEGVIKVSWAKFKIDSTGSGFVQIVFYFLWENLTDQYVLINGDSWLMCSGFGRVDIPGHWYEDESSAIQIVVWLDLEEWWNQPPTIPPQLIQSQSIFDLSIDKPFLGSTSSP